MKKMYTFTKKKRPLILMMLFMLMSMAYSPSLYASDKTYINDWLKLSDNKLMGYVDIDMIVYQNEKPSATNWDG